MEILERLQTITPLDSVAMHRAERHFASIAKPLNSLGLLEKLIVQIAGITGNDSIDLTKKAVVVMCADNGVVEEGVTQTSNEVTATVAQNLTQGNTCVCQMAKSAGANVIPVDIGIARDIASPGMLVCKLAYGTYNMTKGPAMCMEQAQKAVSAGIDIVKSLKDQGYSIIATGEMGIGNTTTSSAMASVFLNQDPQTVTGKGAGLSSAGLARKIRAIQTAIAVNKPDPNNAMDVLAKVGGYDIAGMAGLFLGGAIYHIPIVVDGFISSVAALTAMRLCPTVKEYLIGSHVSNEPAGQMIVHELGLHPILHAQMCLGEGTGAVALFPILDMAASVYNNMSTFEEAKIERYQPLK